MATTEWGSNERLLQLMDDARAATLGPEFAFGGYLTAFELGMQFALEHREAALELSSEMLSHNMEKVADMHTLLEDLYNGPPEDKRDEVVMELRSLQPKFARV